MSKLAPLPIEEGIGPYHVNQFRVYFKPLRRSDDRLETVETLAGDFIDKFPIYFNRKNLATVILRPDIEFLNNPSLRFLIDLRVKILNIDLPDIHPDWVGIVWKDPTVGFAVQTLKRNFDEPFEQEFRLTAESLLAQCLVNIFVGPVVLSPQMIEVYLMLNRMHFLAGRRSWIIKSVPNLSQGSMRPQDRSKESAHILTGNSHKFVAGPMHPIFYLETAAVERYSSFWYRLAAHDPGIVMKMREAVSKIWINLLNNYMWLRSFGALDAQKYERPDDGSTKWKTCLDIRYREAFFDSPAECIAPGWVKDLLLEHPALCL